jgi:hypothetical protein
LPVSLSGFKFRCIKQHPEKTSPPPPPKVLPNSYSSDNSHVPSFIIKGDANGKRKIYKHRPGKPLGAGAGDISACEPVSLEGAGEGAPLILSLSHNSEQFVFQKPIFSL